MSALQTPAWATGLITASVVMRMDRILTMVELDGENLRTVEELGR